MGEEKREQTTPASAEAGTEMPLRDAGLDDGQGAGLWEDMDAEAAGAQGGTQPEDADEAAADVMAAHADGHDVTEMDDVEHIAAEDAGDAPATPVDAQSPDPLPTSGPSVFDDVAAGAEDAAGDAWGAAEAGPEEDEAAGGDASAAGSMPAWLQPRPAEVHGADASDVIRHEGVEASSHRQEGPSAPQHGQRPERDVAATAAEAANAVGTFFSEGAAAVRAMNAAKKAHAEAREQLDALDRTIAEEEQELAHRRDVAGRYHEIIKQETARKKRAAKAVAKAEAAQKTIDAAIEKLKAQLEQVKAADAQTEKRLKAALDAAEAKEASSREASSRLKRRLDDAERNLAKAEEDKKNGIAAATTAAESAEARLKTLREEFAEVQRNPSANSAAYNVRANELEAQISDAMHELREARDGLPQLTAELNEAIRSAQNMLAEAKKPIDAAKKDFEKIREDADDARDAYETAKKEANERQRALREQISEQEKERHEQEQAASDARDEGVEAQLLIDEAEDIHAHPDVTEAIAGRLEADRAERAEQAGEVEQLAAAEQDVREQTRSSRLRFIAVIAAIVAAIVLIVVLWLVLS